MSRPCDVDAALGRELSCPGEDCALYVDGGCVVAGLRADLAGAPDLARLLVTVRDSIGVPPRAFQGILAPGLHD